MRIAVTYENGEIFQHFGHTEQFKLYDVEEGKIVSAQVVDSNGSADAAAEALAAGQLVFKPNLHCDHHDHHGEGHSCGEHGFGSHSCG